MFQWLTVCASTAGRMGLISRQGTKIPYGTQCSSPPSKKTPTNTSVTMVRNTQGLRAETLCKIDSKQRLKQVGPWLMNYDRLRNRQQPRTWMCSQSRGLLDDYEDDGDGGGDDNGDDGDENGGDSGDDNGAGGDGAGGGDGGGDGDEDGGDNGGDDNDGGGDGGGDEDGGGGCGDGDDAGRWY